LAGGTYAVYVGLVGSFDLTVADDGTMGVTSPAATIPDGSTLLLNNCSVLIDPAAYEGHWTVTRYTNPEWLSGSAPLVLVPGLDYELNIAWSGHIRFGLDEHGVPNTLATDSFEIKTEPATIRFKTYPITVDVDQYAGNWGIYQVQDRQPGSRTLALVPGLDYVFEIAWPSEARLRPLTWTATGRLVASSNPQLPRLARA